MLPYQYASLIRLNLEDSEREGIITIQEDIKEVIDCMEKLDQLLAILAPEMELPATRAERTGSFGPFGIFGNLESCQMPTGPCRTNI